MVQSTLDAALAAALPAPRTWGPYILDRRVQAGKVGRRWQQGAKIHAVTADYIVGFVADYNGPAPRMRVGDVFSAHTPCNSNGQHIARPVADWSLDQVTCQSCLKSL
jgi:hypothetical protein